MNGAIKNEINMSQRVNLFKKEFIQRKVWEKGQLRKRTIEQEVKKEEKVREGERGCERVRGI